MKPIWNCGTCWSILAAVVLVLTGPATAKAAVHDCGEFCSPCGVGWKEGTGHDTGGEYRMSCHLTSGSCAECPISLVGDVSRRGIDMAMLTSIPLSALLASVGDLRERLLVYPERNMVALRGERCAVDGIVAVVFLPKERVVALARAGIPTLARFLAQQTTLQASAIE